MCNPFRCDALASKPIIFNLVRFQRVRSHPIQSITDQSDPIQTSTLNIAQSGSDLILTIQSCFIRQDPSQSDLLPNPTPFLIKKWWPPMALVMAHCVLHQRSDKIAAKLLTNLYSSKLRGAWFLHGCGSHNIRLSYVRQKPVVALDIFIVN